MLRHLGDVAIALSIDAPTNRRCRLASATPARLRALIAENVGNLARVLRYNVAHDIRLYRISSDLVPFASHPVNRVRWWAEFERPLADLGAYIRRHGLRVSMHPGPFTVLNSLNSAVARAAGAEVAWHARFLDVLGVGADAKIIVHVGGMADGREAALARFVAAVRQLPAVVRRRLIVENDEHLFTAEDTLEASHATGIPVVFDWLHHRANPGRARTPAGARRVIADCFATWGRSDGAPKIHLSSQARGGRRGQHGDWIRPRDLLSFLAVAPPVTFDCMLEAKRKDQALLRLRRDMARWGIAESGRRAPIAVAG
jgi:UV DNA damage endonuclease